MVYPAKISTRLKNIRHFRQLGGDRVSGTGARFACGCFVRYSVSIDDGTKLIRDISFMTNGCGYMSAAADEIADAVKGRRLTELHGLDDFKLFDSITTSLGPVPVDRRECLEACSQALHAALADFRRLRLKEFSGESALICTCFSVTEERIEAIITETDAQSVDDVSTACNAGLGCGSCRMMIDEMIDARMR
ncbi:MAG: (2Fe-2S)-binding protein [Pyrinomonadaceae bacterium]